MIKQGLRFLLVAVAISGSIFSIGAQMKRREPTDAAKLAAPTPTPGKKNERPTSDENSSKTAAPPNGNQSADAAKNPTNESSAYKYEFTQPNFVVKHVVIEHDASGKGTITFEKKNAEEPISDPLQVSAVSLEKINNLLQTLNFLDSTEDYQSSTRDYGHLGDYEITWRKDGKTRTAKYNWSENAIARELANEYRKIGEQAVWLFDMTVARENQPLEAPGLMDRLDSLLKRNEVSDPPQLLPALKDFSRDERLPLMARNHATRIIKEIEKHKQK